MSIGKFRSLYLCSGEPSVHYSRCLPSFTRQAKLLLGANDRLNNLENFTTKFLHTTFSIMSNNFNVNYEELVKEQENKNVLIIDVREQSEINETGKLPGSIHIPMGEVSNMITNLSEESFKQKYEKFKPTKDTKIILSCKAGRRSGTVQEELQKLGYKNVYNYIGGWLDWENKQK